VGMGRHTPDCTETSAAPGMGVVMTVGARVVVGGCQAGLSFGVRINLRLSP
jgi:hypothetical protein